MKISEILAADEGPARTAALVTRLQDLFEGDGAVPVLVGGAAVERWALAGP